MALVDQIAALATRAAQEIKAVRSLLSGKADSVHGHALTDANITGVLPIAQIPTGSTATTVALGNHVHTSGIAGTAVTSGIINTARLPVATEAAAGTAERASDAEALALTDDVRYISPLKLGSVLTARVGPTNPIALFIGNSHTTPSAASWPNELSAVFGWEVKNFAVSGMGFTYGASQYSTQVTIASSTGMTAAERARVRVVFVGDMGNDVRAGVTPAAIKSAADALWAQIKAAFPLARIVCLPILWGTDATNSTQTNKSRLAAAIPALTESCLAAGVEHIDGSWTWHWGRTDLQDSGDFHYTAAGKTWIAKWVERYLRGSDTWYDRPAVALTGYGNGFGGYTGSGWQAPSWQMIRGVITINGAIQRSGSLANLAILNLPLEARPRENRNGVGCEAQWGTPGDLICTMTTGTVGTISISYPLL